MSGKAGSGVVLLVEDNADDVFFMKMAFDDTCKVARLEVASDGEEAIALLSASGAPPPRLVLLDLKLPFMSGLEVLEWIKGQPILREVPVVVLTSSSERPDFERARTLGAADYLVKPVAYASLVELVKNLCSRWRIGIEARDPESPGIP